MSRDGETGRSGSRPARRGGPRARVSLSWVVAGTAVQGLALVAFGLSSVRLALALAAIGAVLQVAYFAATLARGWRRRIRFRRWRESQRIGPAGMPLPKLRTEAEMRELVTSYVEAAIDQKRRRGFMRVPIADMPPAMRDPTIEPSNDWIGWRPIESTVTEADLDAIEARLGARLPLPYRIFLRYQHFYELTEAGVRFTRHPSDRWRAELEANYTGYSSERIVGRGLVPFGSESFADAGPVCFDTTRTANGDCPVVFWDHEWIGTEREVRPMFSSSAAMFAALRVVASHDFPFFYHDESDPPDSLPARRMALREFLAADPDGAGSVARAYWTTWGVEPA